MLLPIQEESSRGRGWGCSYVLILKFEVLVCSPSNFFLGDFYEDVEHGGLYENRAVLFVCLYVKALEVIDAVLNCGLVHDCAFVGLNIALSSSIDILNAWSDRLDAFCFKMLVLARAIASWMDSPSRRMIDTDIVLGGWGLLLPVVVVVLVDQFSYLLWGDTQ